MGRASLFVAVGRLSARLPAVRGRTRAFLELYRLLGLERDHVYVETTLRAPVPYRARLDLHSWLQRIAFLTGEYESDTVRFLSQLASDGYLLDIGANVGLLAVPFARMTGRPVIAIEAISDNARALRANVDRNGLASLITVIEVALGDAQRWVEAHVEGNLAVGEGTGTASIMADGSTFECVRQSLPITTLDSLHLPLGCGVVKLDTDGYDLKILQGSESFLARERPLIFGEFARVCLGWHGQAIQDVDAFARTHGYSLWPRILGTWSFSNRLREAQPFIQDALLVPQEAAGRVRALISPRAEQELAEAD